MWHTPEGDRKLSGAEGRLLKAGLTGVVERLKEESSGHSDQCEYGIGVFDHQTWSQRLALLEQVATYLFSDTEDTLTLTAVNESAIGAIFEHLRSDVELEVEAPYGSRVRIRELVLAAYRESRARNGYDTADDLDAPCSPAADDLEVWSDLIESLADRVLWDRDYEMEYLFMDVDPDKARTMRDHLGIDADYFSSAPPDIAHAEVVENVYQRLSHLRSARDSEQE
jgi:hypothetical protein